MSGALVRLISTAGEAGTDSYVAFSYRLLHMGVPVLTDQQRHIHQLCVDTGCNLEDLPEVIVDKNG